MVHVTSEIGRLRRALVHEPGPEVDRMVPAMMGQLLFDDILYGDRARDEHAQFRRVLQLFGIEVREAADLLAQALEQDAARAWVVDVLLQDLSEDYRNRLRALPAPDLASLLVTGDRHETEAGGIAIEDLYDIPPLPNWCFQRDPQVIFRNGVIFCSMAAEARFRESLLSRTLFRFHPELSQVPVIFDPLEADRDQTLFVGQQLARIEGGDVLVFSPDVIAIGISERTNRAGVKYLARAMAGHPAAPRTILVVELPRKRAYMHLDTLITQVDRDACLVYPPVILAGGAEEAKVWELDLKAGDLQMAREGDLLRCLERHGLGMEPIYCGGHDPMMQQREQWTDGSNAFALAPGVIVLYDRNLATAEELGRHGFEIIEARDLLLGRAEVDIDRCGRVCILIPSHEISRARGGPHCLVHPLIRDELA